MSDIRLKPYLSTHLSLCIRFTYIKLLNCFVLEQLSSKRNILEALYVKLYINVQPGRKIRLATTKGSYTKDKKHLPKHMWGLLFKPDACFMKYYMQYSTKDTYSMYSSVMGQGEQETNALCTGSKKNLCFEKWNRYIDFCLEICIIFFVKKSLR